MSQEITLQSEISGLEHLKQSIAILAEESVGKAYLIANTLKKLGTDLEKEYKDGFRSYYDEQKELPAGFTCKVSTRTTYAFKENPKWAKLKEQMDETEKIIKHATDQNMKGISSFDANGELIEPVSVSFSEVYAVSRPKK